MRTKKGKEFTGKQVQTHFIQSLDDDDDHDDDDKLSVLESRVLIKISVPKWDEVTQGCRKSTRGALRSVRFIKHYSGDKSRLRWAGQEARMAERRGS